MVEAGERVQGAGGRRRVPAHVVFYPAAAAYGMLVLPASMLSLLGSVPPLPGLSMPAGHAHEMLFGFTLAVIAGNQLGPMRARDIAVLAAAWASARVAFLLAPQSVAAIAASGSFAFLLAWRIGRRLFGSAKKWRNQALPAVLMGICASALALPLAMRAGSGNVSHAVLTVAVLLVALLLLFMGGRLIAPAVAGQFYRQGGRLDARVQPRLEGSLIAAMAIAVTAAAFDTAPWSTRVCALGATAAGILAAARLLRWRLWALQRRPDLLCLACGYAWLACGLCAFGVALAAARYETTALHLITIGSLGTLTFNVMAMTHALQARTNRARMHLPVWGTCLIGLAALARIAAGLGFGSAAALLLAASLLWSSAFALLLARLVRRA